MTMPLIIPVPVSPAPAWLDRPDGPGLWWRKVRNSDTLHDVRGEGTNLAAFPFSSPQFTLPIPVEKLDGVWAKCEPPPLG